MLNLASGATPQEAPRTEPCVAQSQKGYKQPFGISNLWSTRHPFEHAATFGALVILCTREQPILSRSHFSS